MPYDGSVRCKLDPESVNLSGDQGRVDTGLQTRGGKSTRSFGSCSPEKTGRPFHEHNRAFCRAWGWPGPGGGKASVRALTAKAPGQQLLPLRWACVWGSARVSGKAPRLRARGTPEGQLGHDPFPPLGVGSLQGGAGGGVTQSSRGAQGTSSTAVPPADLMMSLTGHSLGSPCGCGHGPCGGLSSKSPRAGTRSFRSHDSQS